MTAKNRYFSLVFVASLLFSSIHPLSQDTSIMIIQEFKKALKTANLTIKTIAQESIQSNSNTFSQAQEKEKIHMLFYLFSFLNQTGLKVAEDYLKNSPTFKDLCHQIPETELPATLNRIDTITTQTQPSLLIEAPIQSKDYSTYVQEMVNVFEKNAKDVLQKFFEWLKESCPELDPQILSD